ncbi:MAG: hypothetical protein ACI8VW_003719, partial [bacterium]
MADWQGGITRFKVWLRLRLDRFIPMRFQRVADNFTVNYLPSSATDRTAA